MRQRLENFVSLLWFLSLASVAVLIIVLYYLHKPVTVPVLIAVGAGFVLTTAAHTYLTWKREKAEKKSREKE